MNKEEIGNTKQEKLQYWQELLVLNEQAYGDVLTDIDTRDKMRNGDRTISSMVSHGGTGIPDETKHVRNMIAELIEAGVDSSVPVPKVISYTERNERLAEVIENMIRNEQERLQFYAANDIQERICPLHGSGFYYLDWDSSINDGEIVLQIIHPKQLIPQDGVITGIDDMDYFFLKFAQTKEYLEKRYNVTIDMDGEEEPDIRANPEEGTQADDMLTQYVCYYKNNDGGIGRFSWVNDQVLEDLDDYQARRLKRCKDCGALYFGETDSLQANAMLGFVNTDMEEATAPTCPECGGHSFKEGVEEYEELWEPIQRYDGTTIGGSTLQPKFEDGEPVLTEFGEPVTEEQPTLIPYYKTNMYPIVEQKNISDPLQFLGESDADKIADQQNAMNILCQKVNDMLMAAGSYIILPSDVRFKTDGTEAYHIPLKKSDMAMANYIRAVDCHPDITPFLSYMDNIYNQARDILGITDSFQGKKDTTARSGKAKEFAAAQAAGRLESKRVMKATAYGKIFELIFKLMLAYADTERAVLSEDKQGKREYLTFNKYDFLEQDAAGNWYWNDNFLFTADTSAPLAGNRAAMWQETLMNFQLGTFGNPTEIDTLIAYWTKMEKLHYPNASQTKEYLQSKKQAMMEQQQKQHEAVKGQVETLAAQKAKQDADAMMQEQQMGQVEQQAIADAAAAALQGGQG